VTDHPAAARRAETAWYAGDLDAVRTIVTPALAVAEEPWHLGELALLLSRTEPLSAVPTVSARANARC
jgi:hypothetical protein